MTASDKFASRGIMRTKHSFFDLVDPQPHMVHLDEGTESLSKMIRFNAHSDLSVLSHQFRAYSYAIVELGITDERLLRTVLMHDFHEAYVGDCSNPMKNAMRILRGEQLIDTPTEFERVDVKAMECVALTFDLIWPHPKEVAIADLMALAAEVEMTWDREEVIRWGLTPVEKHYHFSEGSHLRTKYMNTVRLSLKGV